MALPDPYVLIDLETTGANPVTDRITEIAMLRFERGVEVGRWQTLVNPGRGIPPYIQKIIGISDDMVASAPSFADLAERVCSGLKDAVFVAHNARFDYGFIRNEFARMGEVFDASVLCTVKFSRALYPEFHRHGLDALIERHSLKCDARHRAMGDVEVLAQFIAMVESCFPAETITRAAERAMKFAARPPGLPVGVLEGLPESPGVYFLYGDQDALLLVGRGANLRARVTEHFSSGKRKGKEAELALKVRRLEWEETAGEMAAMLRELDRVRILEPIHNRPGSPADQVFGLRLLASRKNASVLQRVALAGTDPTSWEGVQGLFRARKEAEHVLRQLAQAYRLCLRRLGLEAAGAAGLPARGACSAYAQKTCAGVCVGKESADSHDARLLGALGSVALKPWPWTGAVVVSEQSQHTERIAHHVFDQWCHLGSADSDAALAALIERRPPRRFDLDLYRMLQRWLASDDNRQGVRSID